MLFKGRTDFLLQLQSNAGEWNQAKLCPSTDPLRVAWTDDKDLLNVGNQETDTEVMNLMQSDDGCVQEETTCASELADIDDNVVRLIKSCICSQLF